MYRQMNRIVFSSLALLMVLLTACNTGNRMAKAERQAEISRQVLASVEERQFTIAVDWMKPLRGMSKHLSYGYELKLNGDELDSYLPYVGEAQRLPYGGGKGLNFKAPVYNYSCVQSSGKALIDVWARDRDAISFQGEMVF